MRFAESHWRKPGRRRNGSPKSEDLPVARHFEPLAEGGFVARRLLAVAVLALVLPAGAFAATVHIRVEGQTRTLFGAAPITVTATTPLEALQRAATIGEFYYHLTNTSFGPYVDQIGLYPGTGDSGWAYKVDNASPPVGADSDQLKDGDTVLWYWATFGQTGGPPTLSLAKSGACYTVSAFDDNGKAATVSGVTLHVGSKKTVTATLGKQVCLKPHLGLLVRATATSAVRSNALQ
jgi:hypothetical protein